MLIKTAIIQKLKGGKYRLYSKKKDKSGKRRNLGTYNSLAGAKKREREVQYFKHHADDGSADDKETKALSKLSDIAGFLEEAGFIDASDKVYMAMNAVDGSLCEDNVIDVTKLRPDDQVNVGGPQQEEGGSAGSMQENRGTFSIQEAEKLANLANTLDKQGLYEEADAIDDILKVIKKLEKKEKNKKKHKVKDKDKKKQKEEAPARSNGRVGTGVTDNQNAGMFQGFSDAYFYSGYGNLEGAYGPSDR